MKAVLLLSLCIHFANGQTTLAIERRNEDDLIRILNRITPLTEKTSGELSIRVFTVSNFPGSAGYQSGEVTHQLYIAVSEHDEYPKQSLFTVGPIYNPKAKGWREGDKGQLLTIEYGPAKRRESITLRIGLETIEVLE